MEALRMAAPTKKPGLANRIAEPFIRPMVVSILDRYSQDLEGLKGAILLNMDIYQLWEDKCEEEGVTSPEQARQWTRMAPDAKDLLTAQNVRIWLMREKKFGIINTIDSTAGGNEWLERTLKRFRDELWR